MTPRTLWTARLLAVLGLSLPGSVTAQESPLALVHRLLLDRQVVVQREAQGPLQATLGQRLANGDLVLTSATSRAAARRTFGSVARASRTWDTPSAYARARPPVPSLVPPNQREETATTSPIPECKSTVSMGLPPVPLGSPASLRPTCVVLPGNPATKAQQWWVAPGNSSRICSTKACAAFGVGARASEVMKRLRETTCSARCRPTGTR